MRVDWIARRRRPARCLAATVDGAGDCQKPVVADDARRNRHVHEDSDMPARPRDRPKHRSPARDGPPSDRRVGSPASRAGLQAEAAANGAAVACRHGKR
jgi:hypothetical protein